MSDIADRLKTFLAETFSVSTSGFRLDENMSFLDSGLIDSTGVLELVDFLEEEYDITVEDEELIPENLDSISNLCRYLAKKGVDASGK